MGTLGRKMKMARSGGETAWTQRSKHYGNDRCGGCGVKFKEMTAAQFNRHLAALKKGQDDCPDV